MESQRMNIWLTVFALAIMAIGLLGIIIPILPGLPLIYVAYLLYGLLTGWQEVTVTSAVVFGVILIISLAIDYLAIVWGVKRYQASKSGIWGAILGALLGVVVLNFPGLIIGPIVGAFIGELIDGKPHPLAARAALGALVGLLAGGFVRIIAGVTIIGVFLWYVL